jgi:hypothetical protein
MALPFVLWGAAALLAGTGVIKGVEAKGNFDKAKRIGEDAQEEFQDAESSLMRSRDKTNSEFEKLGRIKVMIFNHQIKHLVDVIKKSKESKSILKGFNSGIDALELKEMERLVTSSLEIEKGLGSGAVAGALAAWGAYGSVGMLATASTGTAISTLSGAAATNATLAWLGGGALSAGGFGMAGGALALGGIVLGPALAVGGFMMASKAEEAVTKAREYEADVDIAVAEMRKMGIVLEGLQTNAIEMGSVLTALAQRFDAIKVNDDSNRQAFDQMVIVGKGLKSVLDTPIMEKDGSATKNLRNTISGYLEI